MPLNMTPPATPDITRNRATSKAGPISFRLDDAALDVLEQRAVQRRMSRHELARQYVEDELFETEERAALRDAIITLQRDLIHLRSDLALASEALLVSAGKVQPEEAHTWVEQNLLCSPSPNP